MNEVYQIFIGSMVVAFSGALVPGPMLTLVISSVARKGFWTSFFIVVGHSLLELVVVISFFLGILKYLDNPLITKIIGILGGVFLLYLGIDIVVSIFKKKFTIDFKSVLKQKTITGKSTGTVILKGILISLVNPYWYIWWISIGAAFLIKSVEFNTLGISSFYIGHISADFIWYLFIGFLVNTGRRFFNQKIYNSILIACSIFLFYLGIRFIIEAII
ncbi:MAG: LysE family transporter [Candidatus Hydromicrobium sp.]|nr:LysE family transporter [Candidatus Hydromicrobium sp.]